MRSNRASRPARGRRTDRQYRRLCTALKMRDRGAPWREIGQALGITRQAASQMVKAYERTRRGLPRRSTKTAEEQPHGRR